MHRNKAKISLSPKPTPAESLASGDRLVEAPRASLVEALQALSRI